MRQLPNRKSDHEPTDQRKVAVRVPKPRKHDHQNKEADNERPAANVGESARTDTVIDEEAAPRKRQDNLHAS